MIFQTIYSLGINLGLPMLTRDIWIFADKRLKIFHLSNNFIFVRKPAKQQTFKDFEFLSLTAGYYLRETGFYGLKSLIR